MTTPASGRGRDADPREDAGQALGPEVHGEMGRMAATFDAEVRAEQAEYEAMALQAQWRARTTSDVAREWMVRADHVEVRVAGMRLTGEVVAVGRDWLALSTPVRGVVDVSLAAGPVMRVLRHTPGTAVPPARAAPTFEARLTEHEVTGVPMVLVTRDGTEVEGVVAAVARDHVLVGERTAHHVLPSHEVALAWSAGR